MEGGDGESRDFPAEQIDRVLVYGRVNVTPTALAGLLDRGVPTTLLSSRGRLRGFLASTVGGQVRRRAHQYALMQQPELGLPCARALVTAKLRNQHRLLQSWMHQDAASLKPFIAASRRAPDAATLRGIEGSAARAFFGCFPRLLAGTPRHTGPLIGLCDKSDLLIKDRRWNWKPGKARTHDLKVRYQLLC